MGCCAVVFLVEASQFMGHQRRRTENGLAWPEIWGDAAEKPAAGRRSENRPKTKRKRDRVGRDGLVACSDLTSRSSHSIAPIPQADGKWKEKAEERKQSLGMEQLLPLPPQPELHRRLAYLLPSLGLPAHKGEGGGGRGSGCGVQSAAPGGGGGGGLLRRLVHDFGVAFVGLLCPLLPGLRFSFLAKVAHSPPLPSLLLLPSV